MTTVKELRALAKEYGLPGRSKLKKNDLIKAIAEVRAREFIKRLQRATKTGRFSAIQGDVENPHKKGRRGRELSQIKDEVDASLRGNKYTTTLEKKPMLRLGPLRKITHRLTKPHLHGLTHSLEETLARAIAWEGPGILKNYLNPDEYYTLEVENFPALVLYRTA